MGLAVPVCVPISVCIFHMAFFCSYITLQGRSSTCGQSSDYPGHFECVSLKDCTRDVSSHLASFKLSGDEGFNTEMKLLLARVG